jgi:hypothetical protein
MGPDLHSKSRFTKPDAKNYMEDSKVTATVQHRKFDHSLKHRSQKIIFTAQCVLNIVQ